MLVTIVTARPGRAQVHQFDAPTVKDCLVAWAGKVEADRLTDADRTRLRGDMADFDAPPLPGFGNVWRLAVDLAGEEATLVVVETARA
jgi:hypothetical protein